MNSLVNGLRPLSNITCDGLYVIDKMNTYFIIFCLSSILCIFSALGIASLTPGVGVNVCCVIPNPTPCNPIFRPSSPPTPIGVPTWLNPNNGVSVAICSGVVRFGWRFDVLIIGFIIFWTGTCGIVCIFETMGADIGMVTVVTVGGASCFTSIGLSIWAGCISGLKSTGGWGICAGAEYWCVGTYSCGGSWGGISVSGNPLTCVSRGGSLGSVGSGIGFSSGTFSPRSTTGLTRNLDIFRVGFCCFFSPFCDSVLPARSGAIDPPSDWLEPIQQVIILLFAISVG